MTMLDMNLAKRKADLMAAEKVEADRLAKEAAGQREIERLKLDVERLEAARAAQTFEEAVEQSARLAAVTLEIAPRLAGRIAAHDVDGAVSAYSEIEAAWQRLHDFNMALATDWTGVQRLSWGISPGNAVCASLQGLSAFEGDVRRGIGAIFLKTMWITPDGFDPAKATRELMISAWRKRAGYRT
jgi:hypothetical protein